MKKMEIKNKEGKKIKKIKKNFLIEEI